MIRPAITEPRPWRFPNPARSSLGSGLGLAFIDLPGQALASVELVLPTPLEAEPRELEGVATVVLHACDEATVTLPDIVERLELQGAALLGRSTWGYTRLGVSAPARRLPKVLELFASVVREPAFDEPDLAHHVETQVAAWKTRMASPTAVTREALRTSLFGPDQREGRPIAGSPETLGAIDQDAARNWHERAWVPQGATLILAGDLTGLDTDELTAPLEAWRGVRTPAPAPQGIPGRPGIVLVDLPQAAQTVVQAFVPIPGRDAPEWAALKLGGHIMCGAFASRLNLELRERLGYTYGVSGGVSARRTGGSFVVETALNSNAAADAVARLLDALTLQVPFTEGEVLDAARYLVQASPLQYETAADITVQTAALIAAGFDPDFVNRHRAALSGATAEQVNSAWWEHIRPENITIVIGGPARLLEPGLRAAGIEAEITG